MKEQLEEICATLTRIESKLTTSADQFAAHAAEDALLAHDVRQLAKRQRGFISGLAAGFVAVGVAVDYTVKRIVGH